MRVFKVVEAYQDLKRSSHIAGVFVRYGFGELLERVRGEHYHPRRRRAPSRGAREFRHLSTPERLRMAFEELGPTFIKFGQLLSTRVDVLPPAYVEEFSKLQDQVHPFPLEEARGLIEAELGKPLSELFEAIAPEPAAAASLAQVYRATTIAGEEVAIKVQRPGIHSLVDTDIRILYELATLSEKYVTESRYYGPVALVEAFAKTIRRELDFVREGRNIERFRRYFFGDPTVYIPRVYWNLTARRVLTTEYIRGIKVSDLKEIDAVGLDPKVIAENGANFTLREIFEYHFFHADPHPGNLFVLEDNVIAPVDYGMIGGLSDDMADHAATIFVALVNRDVSSLVRVLQAIGWVHEPLDVHSFELDLQDLLDRYYGVPLQNVDISGVMEEAMGIVRRYNLHMPTELMLVARALLVTQGVGRLVCPEFNIVEYARPYARKLMLRRFDPTRHAYELYRAAGDAFSLIKRLPSEIGQLLSKTMKGELAIRFVHQGLEEIIAEVERCMNRLSFSVVIAALIIGSSLIFQSGLGPRLVGYPVLGLVGFVIASILGLWLLIGIVRSGRL